jgi:hypothetical protein
MKISNLLNKIKAEEECRAKHILELLETEDMIRGSFHQTHTKCGKKECECFAGKGHLCRRMTWSENAIQRTKAVPPSQEIWVKSMTENYKKFRQNRKGIKASEVKINKLLDQIEAKIIKESWNKNKKFKV